MTKKQLERLEEQNRVFDSESISSDSEEESKSARLKSSFEESAGRNTPNNRSKNNISGDMDKTKANTTAKSMDSGIESNEYRNLQESLDSFNHGDSDANRARQEMLQYAQKIYEEKEVIAKQLDKLKDKQRACKAKLSKAEDKNERLLKQLTQEQERHDKQQQQIKKKSFEIDELKLAIDEF